MADNCPTCMALDMLLRSRGVEPNTADLIAYSPQARKADRVVKRKVKRGATKASRKLGRALKEVNRKARKKNGDFKKGFTQSRVMRDAHKLARRMK
jgi:glutaredoxin